MKTWRQWTLAEWAREVAPAVVQWRAGWVPLPAHLRHEADLAFGADALPELPDGLEWAVNTRVGGRGKRIPYRIVDVRSEEAGA